MTDRDSKPPWYMLPKPCGRTKGWITWRHRHWWRQDWWQTYARFCEVAYALGFCDADESDLWSDARWTWRFWRTARERRFRAGEAMEQVRLRAYHAGYRDGVHEGRMQLAAEIRQVAGR